MPIYHIELRTADRVWKTRDVDTDGLESLRGHLARFVGQLLQEHAEQIWTDQDWRIDVTDETGFILYVMHIFATESYGLSPPRR